MLRVLCDYLKGFVFLAVAAVIAWVLLTPGGEQPRIVVPTPAATPAWEPVVARPLVLLTQGPVRRGGVLQYQDGVCNNSGEPLAYRLEAGYVEDKPLSEARSLTVVNPKLAMPVGCSLQDVVDLPLPSYIGPGTWRLSFVFTITKGSQVQDLAVTSEPFVVTD